jgi:hypothetical protein
MGHAYPVLASARWASCASATAMGARLSDDTRHSANPVHVTSRKRERATDEAGGARNNAGGTLSPRQICFRGEPTN